MIGGLFRKKEPAGMGPGHGAGAAEGQRPQSSLSSSSSSDSHGTSSVSTSAIPSAIAGSQMNKHDLKLLSLSSTYSSAHAARSIHPGGELGSYGLQSNTSSDPSNYFLRLSSKIPEKLLDQSSVHFPSLYGLEFNGLPENSTANVGNNISGSNMTEVPSPSFKLSEKLSYFRMLIVQDAGIRRKQPLFDSASPYNAGHVKAPPHKLNKKLFHSVDELALFMFGCYGIPMSESNKTTKIHFLPPLNSVGSSILITQLFSLDSSFELKPSHSSFQEEDSDWEPHPVIEGDEIPLFENSTRFAIGIVIPISSSIESVRDEITNNWSELSDSFERMRNRVIASLKSQYMVQTRSMKAQHSHSYHRNDSSQNFQALKSQGDGSHKLSFPVFSLQSDVELYYALSSVLTKLISLIEISRLFIDLRHSNHALINWASTLSLWKELKDGRAHQQSLDTAGLDNFSQSGSNYPNPPTYSSSKVKFLASLLALFIPLRDKMLETDDNYDDASQILQKVRIVIGTGNPVVSEKLIFLLAGLLGYEKFSHLYDVSEDLMKEQGVGPEEGDLGNIEVENSKTMREKLSEDTHEIHSSIPIPSPAFPSPGNSSPTFNRSIQTRNGSLFVNNTGANADLAGKPSSLRISHSPSVSTISANVQSQRIPVPSLSRTSSYASLQNLSSSYNANIPSSFGSQTSASSWRNNFGSFMERWKNTISPSPTSSQFSQPLTPTAKPDTPSPAAEYEEYPWFGHKKFVNMPNSPTLSSSASFTSNMNPHNKFSLKNNPNYKSYVAIDDGYSINRTCSGLIGTKYNRVVDSISTEITSIMNGYFTIQTELDGEFSLANVHEIDTLNEIDENLGYINQQKLPLLAGYITQFRPEFKLQSCPHKSLGEGVLVESMKNDFTNHKCKKTEMFFINLGMRKVTHLSMDNGESTACSSDVKDGTPDREIPRRSPKSNLTKHMQSGLKLEQEVLLTSTKSLSEHGVLNGHEEMHAISHIVSELDEILEDIVSTVNDFFFKVDDMDLSSEEREHLELKCCEDIRELIQHLLKVGEEG